MTPAQNKALHAAVKAAGIHQGLKVSVHAAVRIICGVDSCTQISHSLASRLINQLNEDKPEPARRRGRAPLRPGEVRLATDATYRQRETIKSLLRQLGWWTGQDALKNGIRDRHKIANLDTSFIDRRAASELINELNAALQRSRRTADARTG